MYEKELEFYEKNKQEIREKYLGKQIVIIGDRIIGAYDDVGVAYDETVKTHLLGTFMIHDVPVDIEDEIETISPFLL